MGDLPVEQPTGPSPQGPHGTVLEPLGSYGSYQSQIIHQQRAQCTNTLGSLFGGLKPNKPPVLPGEIRTSGYEKITSDDRMVVVWRPHYQVSKEVINMVKNKVNHSAHSTWRCQYHIVFAPKFRRKAIYGDLKADIGQILRKLCEEKKVKTIEAEACADHIHRQI